MKIVNVNIYKRTFSYLSPIKYLYYFCSLFKLYKINMYTYNIVIFDYRYIFVFFYFDLKNIYIKCIL